MTHFNVWEKFPVNLLYIYVCNITWRIGPNILRTSLTASQWHSRMFTMSSVWPLSPLETLWTFGIPPCLLVWAETPEVGNFHVFHLGRWFSEELCDVFLYKMYMDLIHYDSFRNQWCVLFDKKYMNIKLGISMLIRHNMSQILSFCAHIWKPWEKKHLVSSQ